MVLASLRPSRAHPDASHFDTGRKPRIQACLLTGGRGGFGFVSNNKFLEINHSLCAVALKLDFVLT